MSPSEQGFRIRALWKSASWLGHRSRNFEILPPGPLPRPSKWIVRLAIVVTWLLPERAYACGCLLSHAAYSKRNFCCRPLNSLAFDWQYASLEPMHFFFAGERVLLCRREKVDADGLVFVIMVFVHTQAITQTNERTHRINNNSCDLIQRSLASEHCIKLNTRTVGNMSFPALENVARGRCFFMCGWLDIFLHAIFDS